LLPLIADTSKRISEIGAVLGVVGALTLAWGAYTILTANRTSHEGITDDLRRRERTMTALGGALLALAFALTLFGLTSKAAPTTPTTGTSPSASSTP
jgi:hypothetical protein